MKSLRVRPACLEDQNEIKKLWKYSFSKDTNAFVDWYFDEYFDISETLVVVNELNQIMGSAQLIHQEISINENILNAQYIVGVDCWPEYRGRGVIKKMMRHILQCSQVDLLILMPFEANFYLKYGFRFADWHGQMVIPIQEFLEDIKKDGHYTRQNIQSKCDISQLSNIYNTWQERYFDFYLIRNKRRWKSILDDLALEDGEVVYVHNQHHQVIGYMLYSLTENTINIREMAYIDEMARRQLYYFVASHRSQVSFVKWSAPMRESIVRTRPRDKDSISIYPFIMIRMIRPEILVHLTKKKPDTNINFAIIDKQQPSEIKEYRWFASENVIKETTDNQTIEFTLTIESLTKMVFESMPFIELLGEPDIEINDMERLKHFYQLFEGRKTCYFNEYF